MDPPSQQSNDDTQHSRNQSLASATPKTCEPTKAKQLSSVSTNEYQSTNNNIPEPLDIMPKSLHMHDEQIKTGAQIGFINLERFLAGRQLELEKLAASNGNA